MLAPTVDVVVMVSEYLAVAPLELVAVQVQLDGYPTQALLAVPLVLPFAASPVALPVKPVPLAVQLYAIDVAFVVTQVTVYPWPAFIGEGVRVTLVIVGFVLAA
jgi:hypothetical protein